MGTSTFDDCGSYAGRLERLSKTIFEIKVKNGEPVTKLDKEIIDNDIFQAYQRILEIAKDGRTISLAIQNMANIFDRNGNVNIETVAISSVKMAVEQTKGINYEQETNQREIVEPEIAYIMTEEQSKESDLDLVFNQEVKDEINVNLERAKKGDIEATSELKTIQSAAGFLERFDTVDKNLVKGALAWMRRLATLDSEAAKVLINRFAEKYNLDVYEVNENGESTFSAEKLEALYEVSVSGTNPKAAKMTNEDFKKIGIRAAKTAIEKGEFTRQEASGMTAESMVTEIKNKSRIMKTRRAVRLAFEENEPSESLQRVASEYPEEIVQILKEKIDISRRLMEKGGNTSRIEALQREIMLLGKVVSEKGRSTTSIDNATKTQKSNTKKEFLDDDAR